MRKTNGFLVYWVPVLAVGFALVFALLYVEPTSGGRRDPEGHLMVQVLDLVEDHYVEPKSRQDLVHSAIRGVVERLDRHSDFLDKAESKVADEENAGRFGGLGIHVSTALSRKNGALTVTRPFRSGPARDAGILPGDRVVSVDGEPLPPVDTNRHLAEILGRLKGRVGTSVTLGIERHWKGKVEELSRTLKRAEVFVDSVVAVRLVDPDAKIGYLRIVAFKDRTVEELDRALGQLEKAGMKSLVIDLRNNGGGLLRRSVEIADRFLDGGVIVATKGRHPQDTEVLYATKGTRVPRDVPVCVLINGGSASASEALAGALQDYRRAVIVGERSYGKGVVQSVYKMIRSKTSLKITTSRYFTPAGRCIERSKDPRTGLHTGGIIPDVVVVLPDRDDRRVTREGGEWDRWLADQVDSRTPPPPPVYEDSVDGQLAAAIELLNGETVVGTTPPREPKSSRRKAG